MDGKTKPAFATLATLRRRAFSLGAANAFDYAVQFLLPVVLVRFLSDEGFGEYRLLWLAVMTLQVTMTLQMPQSLYFFLPRSDAATKRLYVHQTLIYMACAGLVAGLLVGPWNQLLPASMRGLQEYGVLIPAVAVLFGASTLLDILPTIDQRVNLQVRFTIALSVLRNVPLAWAAWMTGDVHVLLWLMVALFTLKTALLYGYVANVHGLGSPWFERRAFAGQFTHVAPFGIASSLNGLRGQADQWVVASLFALGNFATFSIGAVLGPMVTLVRHSVSNVFLPTMSQLQSAGDLAGMVAINGRANIMVATLVYPLLAFAFAFAEDVIALVYTPEYAAAAPVMRVYAVSLVIFVVELSSIMLLLRQGAFALRLNLAVLAVSVAVSWLGARYVGLAGAAVGSTLALYVDRYATLRRISGATGLPLRRLQDWPTLGRLLLFSAVAGALAWLVVRIYFTGAGALPRVLVGGTVLAAVYGTLWALWEMPRRRLPIASAADRKAPT